MPRESKSEYSEIHLIDNFRDIQLLTQRRCPTAMGVRELLNAVIEYETPRYVKVHNPLVGLVLRLVIIIIVLNTVLTLYMQEQSGPHHHLHSRLGPHT